MNALVTGATTPLGRALVDRLVVHGPVLAVGLEEDGRFDHPDVRYVAADLTRARSVRELIYGPATEHGTDVLVHLAFHRRAGRARSAALHIEATRLLLRLAEESPVLKRFVHRSTAEVYAVRLDRPDILREDHPLELAPTAPAWVRERVAADLAACTRMGMSPIDIVVLRCAEILAPDMGSQLHDWLSASVCFRPMGYDPLVNVLSLEDASRAFELAALGSGSGVYNIPGADTLPLTALVRESGRDAIGLPGPILGPLYAARRRLTGARFRYRDNAWRFHFNGVLDGSRAARDLGFRPSCRLSLG
ncbi:MAG: NAD-dependent epimerase/dehydratase family protein [Myxococcales bacterium]|nr:NAD-dependent epimerase/dehydratase family protein [Myxococcales bacterium]